MYREGVHREDHGNDAGRYFSVRVLGDHLPVRVVNTTQSYAGSFQILDGHRLIAIEAIGAWTLSINWLVARYRRGESRPIQAQIWCFDRIRDSPGTGRSP